MKNLTIKCFGDIEIVGEDKLPEGLVIIASGDVWMNGALELSKGSEITCYANITNPNVQVTGEMVLNGKVQTVNK